MNVVDADEVAGDPEGPPADPEDWTDEQWLAWLKATDEPTQDGDSPPPGPVTRAGRITHSSGGFLLGQAMLAVDRAVFGRNQDEVVIVAEGDSEPADEGPFTVLLDPEHPERSSVVFKETPAQD